MYAENLVQTHVGPVITASVYVSSSEFCSVVLKGFVLLVPSVSQISPTSAFSWAGFPELLWVGAGRLAIVLSC